MGERLKGTVTFMGQTTVVEIDLDSTSNMIQLHFPKNTDTRNWYHAVYVKCDLEEGKYEVGKE